MLEKLFEENKSHFSKSDYKIMEFLLRNQRELQYLSTEELTDTLGISSSTISRFWEKIGFHNIREFKQAIRAAENSTPSSRAAAALRQWQQVSEQLGILGKQYEAHIMRTIEQLRPEELDRAVHEIRRARRIYLFATDAAEGVGVIFSYRCRRLGIELIPVKTGSEVYESMINLGSRDLILMFSYSRILSEVRILLKHAETVHCRTILFTDLLTAPELQMADVVLYSYRGEPNEYHSMAAPVTVIDLLAMKLMKEMPDSVERARYLEKLREDYSGIIKR